MIDSFTNAVITVMLWIVGVIADIAGVFGSIANSVKSIPGVGGVLQGLFLSGQVFVNSLGYDFAQFTTRVKNALDAIDNWLDDHVDLSNAVFGWIMDKIDSAYSWADKALDDLKLVWADINDLWDEIPTMSGIFSWIMSYLGITRKSGETWWQAITRRVAETLSWIDIPTFDEILEWVMTHLGIYKQSGESWWDALVRTISGSLGDIGIPNLGDKILEVFGIYRQTGESWWDAIVRTVITAIPGLAGVVNFWNFFWEDLNLFFSDPAEYLARKVEQSSVSFAERLWAVFEKILERIW